jgi:hypothetical protein
MAVTYVGGATAFAITLFGYLYAPQSIYIALGVMIGLLPLSVAPIPRQLALATFRASRNFGDVNPVRTIIRRDIRCLLRMEWRRPVNLLVLSVVAPNASAGQRRKAELVCGLAGDPPVLLLDETFAHLDHQGCARPQDWLAEWSRSRLIVLTHHGGAPVSVSATLAVDRDHVEFSKRPAGESLERTTRE